MFYDKKILDLFRMAFIKKEILFLSLLLSYSLTMPAQAAEMNVTGRIIYAEGHQNAACRTLKIRETGTGRVVALRIPNTGTDNSILSVALTALTSGLSVLVSYDSALTTGCGAEPAVSWIGLIDSG